MNRLINPKGVYKNGIGKAKMHTTNIGNFLQEVILEKIKFTPKTRKGNAPKPKEYIRAIGKFA